jgi:hypothetical protein
MNLGDLPSAGLILVCATASCDPSEDNLDALVPGFLAALVLCGGVTVGIANRILRLADSRLNFALELLNCASNLGSGVAGQVSGMPLCASHHLVDCALHSLLVHLYHLME